MPVTRPFRPVPGVRLSVAAAILLAGCLPGTDAGKEGPQGPLYSCIGEAGYAGTWEELINPIRENPPRCEDPARGKLSASSGAAQPAGSPGDSIFIHTYVMDAQCRFLVDYHRTVPVQAGNPVPSLLWNWRDSEGNLVRSGEYFVNSELVFPDGRKDTVYQKEGFINFCAL